MSYHHLNFEDRTALMLESRKEGFSARKFAELIKRHPSTIYRELKRNSINDVYQARYASDNTPSLDVDVVTENSKSIQSSGNLLLKAIRCLWSPQQIAKRLKTFPDLDQTMNVSHTTIYSTIRALPKGELKKDLLSCLRHENKKRKANGEPKKDSILQDIKTIHERPAEVQERKIPGHWEADLIKGKDNKSSIATLIERNTRLCILATLPDAKAESVRKALTEALKYLPAELRKTLTYDRGREMSEHKILEEDLGIDVYFCDPHSPWQKGTCENMNGLIRQYLPKGIDLNQADQHYLNQVAMSLNTRPK
ncbi:IS30 family transposase [Klebsiella pneumoniae]